MNVHQLMMDYNINRDRTTDHKQSEHLVFPVLDIE